MARQTGGQSRTFVLPTLMSARLGKPELAASLSSPHRHATLQQGHCSYKMGQGQVRVYPVALFLQVGGVPVSVGTGN